MVVVIDLLDERVPVLWLPFHPKSTINIPKKKLYDNMIPRCDLF